MGRQTRCLVFWTVLPLYLLTYKGFGAGDAVFHYAAVKTWIQTGHLHLPESLNKRMYGFFVAQGLDGRAYLALPPGLALASLPFGLVGETIERVLGGTRWCGRPLPSERHRSTDASPSQWPR